MVGVDACRPIVILAERDKLAMDAELAFILRECKIKVITREGQDCAAACSSSYTLCSFGQVLMYGDCSLYWALQTCISRCTAVSELA